MAQASHSTTEDTTMDGGTQLTTQTIDVPGAILTYDIRRSEASAGLPLVLIGEPMGAAGFGTLAGHFPDRTIVTYDPRGTERSQLTAGTPAATREDHAQDLHQLIQAAGGGPVDMFASSGGAANALALVARYPNDVRTLIAHEPPLVNLLPDREAAMAASRAVHATYLRSGFGAGLAHFIAMTSHKGEFPHDWASQPAPDPGMFGLPTDDDGSRDDPLLSRDPDSEPEFTPDFDALRRAPTRIVIAAGADSEGELTHRAAAVVAERLGVPLVIFPSGHAGFLGGEYGQMGEPEAFAVKLRSVLAE